MGLAFLCPFCEEIIIDDGTRRYVFSWKKVKFSNILLTGNPQFTLADQGISRTHFDVHQLFSFGGRALSPVQLSRYTYFKEVGTLSQGIWMCECQVAGDGYHNPRKIPGLFISYNNDMFGVVFLGHALVGPMLCSVSAFKRVKDL